MLQYQILAWLRDEIVSNPRDICARFRHNSGALTRVIDQLAERGFLMRARRDRDRRKIELEITSNGLSKINNLIPLVVDKLNLALKDFSAAEAQELMRLLLKFNASMQSALEPKAKADA
jgi:DNA-binding MarR family transcriptional regulator